MLALVALATLPTSLATHKCNALSAGPNTYDLSRLDNTWTYSSIRDTPPSTTNTTWYINLCGPISNDLCPKDSQICGITYISVDGQDILTEIISVVEDGHKTTETVSSRTNGLTLHFTGGKWGQRDVSARVMLNCSDSDELVRTTFNRGSQEVLSLWNTPAACKNAEKPPGNAQWGFFTWVFLLLVLFVLVFVVITVKLNYDRYGVISLGGETGSLLSDLPYMIKDFFARLASSVSPRRGYSAI